MIQNISEDNRAKAASWRRFSNNKLFREIVDFFSEELKREELIINTVGSDDKSKARFSDRDVAVLTKKNILRLIEYPDRQIALLEGTGTIDTEDNDPFEDEIIPEEEDDF